MLKLGGCGYWDVYAFWVKIVATKPTYSLASDRVQRPAAGRQIDVFSHFVVVQAVSAWSRKSCVIVR